MSAQITVDNAQPDGIDKFLREIGVGRRAIDDPFFDESHKTCRVFRRTGVTVEDDEDLCHDVMKEFPCNVLGCKAMFHNLIDFEIHYNGSHRYVCQECKKIRPNARLLEIHIQETHDSYFQVLAERQPVYQCYVSDCDTKFANPSERHDHCTTIHKFPKNFRFDCEGKKKEKVECGEAMEVEQHKQAQPKPKKTKIFLNKNQRTKTFVPGATNQAPSVQKLDDDQMECSANKSPIESQPDNENREVGTAKSASVAKSTLAFVPRQVASKSYTNALTNNKKMERNVLETETMMDLADSLPG